jgi:RNA recognition motif-containing protein
VTLPSDRDSGRPRGFAFVEMSTDDQASTARERFNGFQLNGRNLRVDHATEKPTRSFGSGSGFGAGPSGGGRQAFSPGPRSRPKGSRRNLRARKRSL